MSDYLFALDIGTRTVIGIVSRPYQGSLQIVSQAMVEHESRSMIDGQIHDVQRVAEAVERVKSSLEEKTGLKLQQVAVAAAGRALVTRLVYVEKEIAEDREIEPPDINNLELDGLRQAHQELAKQYGEDLREKFYCVGYSVVNYYADQIPFLNLQGQRARIIGADVLATFLPEKVVNSLYSVLKRVELEPISLTLEPIAAIDVAIPENLRLLNLALVDVGAGTSDIAISRRGAVVAYGMVPLAGDELTEAIMENYLVDFNTAEKIKRSLAKNREGDIVFRNVMGLEKATTSAEVIDRIFPVLDHITEEIAKTIKDLNGQTSPRAVFCVGGGSQIPHFTSRLADKLGIDPSLVAVKDRRDISGLMVEEDEISGPEGVTVVGISTVALKKFGHDFLSLRINGQEYRLFNSRELDVGNAMALIGYDPRQLIARNGASREFWLNGERQFLAGGLAEPARIFINNKPGSLKSRIKNGDSIIIEAAVDGKDARAFVGDYFDRFPPRVVILGNDYIPVYPACRLDGRLVSRETEIPSGGQVEIGYPDLSSILAGQGIRIDQYQAKVNGIAVSEGYIPQSGDLIELEELKDQAETTAAGQSAPETVMVELNGKTVVLPGGKQYLFIDILRYLDFDLTRPQGKIVMLHNDREARYTDPLKHGDTVKIYWE